MPYKRQALLPVSQFDYYFQIGDRHEFSSSAKSLTPIHHLLERMGLVNRGDAERASAPNRRIGPGGRQHLGSCFMRWMGIVVHLFGWSLQLGYMMVVSVIEGYCE